MTVGKIRAQLPTTRRAERMAARSPTSLVQCNHFPLDVAGSLD